MRFITFLLLQLVLNSTSTASAIAISQYLLSAVSAKVLLSSNNHSQSSNNNNDLTFHDVYAQIDFFCEGLNREYVNSTLLSQSIFNGVYSGITPEEFNGLASETAAYMSTEHPDYGKLAAKIAVTNLHKHTCANYSFSETVQLLYHHTDVKSGGNTTNLSTKLYDKVMKNSKLIDFTIQHDRDFEFDYFGIKTLEKSYLMKIDNRIVETPQYMFMRVALGIHIEDDDDDLSAAIETYHLLSQKWFIHASPTLFQAGTTYPQLSSCFLLNIESDSIEGIYKTLNKCALISKTAGGIGLSVQNIRAKGSAIKGTKGVSNGLVPMLRVFDATARYVDQGGGKRPGAFAIYLEPWHADVFDVLELRKNTGKEEVRARDLFYGLWIPDLFMKRVEADADWTLMCPAECPGLDEVWGDAFEKLYTSYEKQPFRCRRTIRARELWYAILDAQIETGTPYMLYKDACNSKSNQQNLGTIKCSNLCTEIIEFTSPEEIAVCNLASLVLPKFVTKLQPMDSSSNEISLRNLLSSIDNHSDQGCVIDDYTSSIPIGSYNEIYYGLDLDAALTTTESSSLSNTSTSSSNNSNRYMFDHDKLREIVKIVTRNLNKIIDINYYPVPEARRSNMRHRPIGMGVQGLADVFQLMSLPFDCAEARRLNRDIFETIYYAALEASCELAEKNGTYASYEGSPASQGILQFDLWERQQQLPQVLPSATPPTRRWDWRSLKLRIAHHGLRNSLLVAPMPTASTAQILGFNECIEPYTSNIYARRVKAGEFVVVNPHLLRDLVARGLWTKQIRNRIIADGGSIQNIDEISDSLKQIYRTVWEIRQKSLLDMAADRSVYIDQSQSLNAFIPQPDYAKLTSMHFHGWKLGLKTGMYYLRTKPAAKAIQFTVDQSYQKKGQQQQGGLPRDKVSNTSLKSSSSVEVSVSKSGSDDNSDEDDDDDSNSSRDSQIYGEACISCSG